MIIEILRAYSHNKAKLKFVQVVLSLAECKIGTMLSSIWSPSPYKHKRKHYKEESGRDGNNEHGSIIGRRRGQRRKGREIKSKN